MPRKSSASKRELNGDSIVAESRPQKKAKLLDNTDDEDSEADTGAGFKVNEEYARRFEHNKKRAEQHRRTSNQTPEVLFFLADNIQLKRNMAKARPSKTRTKTRRTRKRVLKRMTTLNCSTRRSTSRSWLR